jgi:serine/threonine protein phosphatase PrpC
MRSVTAVVSTSRGLARQANEDSVGALGWLAPLETTAPVALSTWMTGPVVAAVADGLGGHAAGEVASRLAVEHVLGAASGLTRVDAVATACHDIHERLLAAGGNQPQHAGMATTLVVVVVTGDEVIVAHVGDSRAYYVEPGLVEQLTADDVAPGDAGGLLQCLGGRPGGQISPHVTSMPLDPGARFLLCSDGVHGCIQPAELRKLLAEADSVAAVDRLAGAVVEAGAPDNLSMCLLTPDCRATFSRTADE